ncbi:phospholipase [Candidatus Aerophobetes bacterium]|uniref:Phospholipase n=1 Tax=Aerophobetes bacterium TaxID=2030807 RepID=A0A2A4X7L8_UNCAE|nr:MAG: phospholipase [Candidatus Aerophobetes bacterium]
MEESSYQRVPYVKKGKKFINPHLDVKRAGLWEFVLWQCGYLNDKNNEPLSMPKGFAYPNPAVEVSASEPKVSWINHCTFLVEIEGIRILTDPIWGERCSPFQSIGPKRLHEPCVQLSDIPTMDIVLISHNHYDHLDKKVVKLLHQKHPDILWVIPKGMRSWFNKLGIQQVIELCWWEKSEVSLPGHQGVELTITATPAQHFSGRGIFDTDQTLWSGFVVQCKKEGKTPKQFYFVGDTGYNPKDFKAIGQFFGEMDLAMIPIGTYIPHKFMDPIHTCPNKAVEIHCEVNSKLSVGMHWKTFRLSDEKQMQPPYDLFCCLNSKKISPLQFRCLDVGQAINW